MWNQKTRDYAVVTLSSSYVSVSGCLWSDWNKRYLIQNIEIIRTYYAGILVAVNHKW